MSEEPLKIAIMRGSIVAGYIMPGEIADYMGPVATALEITETIGVAIKAVLEEFNSPSPPPALIEG
jgi:hypothetical protein